MNLHYNKSHESTTPDYAVVMAREGGFDFCYPMAEERIGRIERVPGAFELFRIDGAERRSLGLLKPDLEVNRPQPARNPLHEAIRHAMRVLVPNADEWR